MCGVYDLSPVVVDSWSLLTFKRLRVHDALELVHSLRGIFHMSSQVAVEETERVTVEGQPDGHAPFVALRDKQEEIKNTTHNLTTYCTTSVKRPQGGGLLLM